MAHSLPVHLVHIMSFQVRVFVFYIILYFFPKITNNKNDLIDTGLPQLINNDTDHCLPGQRNKCFGLRITLWTQLGACACYWNDSFHELINVALKLIKGKRK